MPEKTLVVQGGRLIDGTGRPQIESSVIVIRAGRFQAVGRSGEVSIPADAEVIDVKGKTVLPGFIDGHGHLEDFHGELYARRDPVLDPTPFLTPFFRRPRCSVWEENKSIIRPGKFGKFRGQYTAMQGARTAPSFQVNLVRVTPYASWSDSAARSVIQAT